MFKRFIVPILVIVHLALTCSTSFAVPDEDIDHHVPAFWQYGSSWGGKKYANSADTIGAKGCAITSLTMLYWSNYMFTLPNSGIFLDPGTLNDWMVNNHTYTPENNVDWNLTGGKYTKSYFELTGFLGPNLFVVPNHCCNSDCTSRRYDCFWVEGDSSNFNDLLDMDTKEYRSGIMKITGKDIKGKSHYGHFTVVGGYDKENSEYRDYDPGQSYALPALGYNKLYKPYTFDRLLRFSLLYSSKNTIDVSSLWAYIHSPVEMQIIDPQGRKTGYDPATGTKIVENPMSDYHTDQPISSLNANDPPGEPYKELVIINPPEGNYIVQLFGSGDGPYTIDMGGTTSDGTVNLSTSLTGTATPSLNETYRVAYSPTGEASLSQTNQAPVANAGNNQTGEQSYEITLDGSRSHDTDGDPITYTWSFIAKPDNSGASLSDSHVVQPAFVPDMPGTYTLQLVVNDYFMDSVPSTVTITVASLKSRISAVPNFSQPLMAGAGFLSFDVNNIGRIGVSAGTISINLTDPDGIAVFKGSQSFGVAVGETKAVVIPVTLSSPKLGNYTLTYTQSDETWLGTAATVTVPNSALVTISFDRAAYRVRDTANVTLNVMNNGKFNIDNATLTVSIPDAGYANGQSVCISQGQTLPLQFSIPIPGNVTAGQHSINATLSSPSGGSIVQTAKITLQDSELMLDIAASSQYVAGGVIFLTVENRGSVDTTYATQKLMLTDNNGTVLYQGSASGDIMAGEIKTLKSMQLPGQISGGMELLAVTLQDMKTGELSSLNKSLVIDGLQAGLLARTGNDIYTNAQTVTAINTIASSTVYIENGTLDIKINRYTKPGTGQFDLFLPLSGDLNIGSSDGQFFGPTNIAVAGDRSVYVVDSGNNRIQQFDSSGSFVTKWGGYGTGNGQFDEPTAIAVGIDGSVYVVDMYNHRIQKFDSTGKFILKWGSYGTGNGQLEYPNSIAAAADGSVYVVDCFNQRIEKFDSNGNFVSTLGSTGTGNGQFQWPEAIAVSADGSVYVVDNGNKRILKFDRNGAFVTKWGSYGNYNGQFYYPSGIAVAADGSVYVSDAGSGRIQKFSNNGQYIKRWVFSGLRIGGMQLTSVATAPNGTVYATLDNGVQKMTTLAEGSETLFETSIPISQSAGATLDYTTDVGILNALGKLYLDATLKNSVGQTIANAEYPFYIINGNTALLFATDKKTYKPGETVTITGVVNNIGTVAASGLNLTIGSKKAGSSSQNLLAATFDIPANGNHAFTVTTTAASEGAYSLTGMVVQNSVTLMQTADQYEVVAPKVSVSITGPDASDRNPFALNVQLVNTGTIDANIQYAVSDNVVSAIDSNSLTISAGQTIQLQYTQQISQTTVYAVNVYGDVSQTATKTVLYGEAAAITMGPGARVYPEGVSSFPVTVTNTGSVDESVSVTYTLSPTAASETKTYYLPKGGSITDTLAYVLTKGTYQLSASSVLPSASATTSLVVAKDPDVTMTTTTGIQGTNSLIPLTLNVLNSGYSDLNGSIAVAVTDNQDKAVWRGETSVAGIKTQTTQNYVVNVDSTGILPGIYSISVTFYGASGQQLAVNQAQVRVLGPIFELTSIPANLSFTVGNQATLTFAVKNTGTLAGSASLSVKAPEFTSQSSAIVLQPGEEKSYSFSFTVPETAVPQGYFADYALTTVQSQGSLGQTGFTILGVDVGLSSTIDKDTYRDDDTAVLTLTITRKSQSQDGTYMAIIRYGSYHDMQSFFLSSQPVTLTFNVPLTTITGQRIFYGVYFQSGTTIISDSVAVNPNQPDLIPAFTGLMTSDRVLTPTIEKDNAGQIAATVGNYGKGLSPATTVAFYEGDTLLDTEPVGQLNANESASVSFAWSVLGNAGNHTLTAVVDPQGLIVEISKTNNRSMNQVYIPDMTLFTSTDQDTYKIRQKVYITSLITNLTSTTTYQSLTVTTKVNDPSGNTVYTGSAAAGSLAPSASSTATEIWSTSGQPADGMYTVTQTATSGGQVLAQCSKTISLLTSADFTLTVDASSRKIKQGEQATYLASIAPFNGWMHEVSMSMDGLPAGTTVTFSPGSLPVPGQSQAVVTNTDTAAVGTNILYLMAQGVDEGDIVSHIVPLSLEVAGFGIDTAAPQTTLIQLEKAEIPVNLASLNGYEGAISLSITGMPHGTKAFFESGQRTVPGVANLTVLTSKYAKPGTYTFAVTGDDGLVKHTLELKLILQPNPDLAVGILATEGPGPRNDALVRLYSSKFQMIKEFTAFDAKYGASAISADLDGDGFDEIIVAEGPGPTNPASLRAYRRDGKLIAEYTAFNEKYGLTLAAADLDGDWSDELIVGMGPDPKNPGTIKIVKFNGSGFAEILTQTMYPGLTYGINIASGDVNGDGVPEIITTPGPGPTNAATIKIWSYNPSGLTELSTFTAFDGFYGANVGVGDIDGDDKDEIIAGTGPDPKNTALVRIFRSDGTLINGFAPYNGAHAYGVMVSSGDMDGDGTNDIITGLGPGPQNEPLVKLYKADGTLIGNFVAYPSETGYGVRAIAGKTGR